MSCSLPHRSVTPIVDLLRSILRGKSYKVQSLRFADQIAARTQPQPCLPGGPYFKITEILYYHRDARREVHPSIAVNLIREDAGKQSKPLKNLTPGKVYHPL